MIKADVVAPVKRKNKNKSLNYIPKIFSKFIKELFIHDIYGLKFKGVVISKLKNEGYYSWERLKMNSLQ